MINLRNIVVKKIDIMKIWRKRVTESVNELIKGEVGNTIIDTKAKTVLPIFSVCNKHTGVT